MATSNYEKIAAERLGADWRKQQLEDAARKSRQLGAGGENKAVGTKSPPRSPKQVRSRARAWPAPSPNPNPIYMYMLAATTITSPHSNPDLTALVRMSDAAVAPQAVFNVSSQDAGSLSPPPGFSLSPKDGCESSVSSCCLGSGSGSVIL